MNGDKANVAVLSTWPWVESRLPAAKTKLLLTTVVPMGCEGLATTVVNSDFIFVLLGS